MCSADNTQGDIVPGFKKPFQTLVTARVTDPEAALLTFGQFVPLISSAAEVEAFNRRWSAERTLRSQLGIQPSPATAALWTNIGFTAEGLRWLNLSVPTGSPEHRVAFEIGLDPTSEDTSHLRSLLALQPAPGDGQLGGSHVIVTIAGDDKIAVERQVDLIGHLFCDESGLEVTGHFHGEAIMAGGHQREHFGFADGLSQPRVGFDPRAPGYHPPDAFLDESGGSFGVVLKIAQDVPAFWEFCQVYADRISAELGVLVTATSVAEKLIGRGINGGALVPSGQQPDAPYDSEPGNDFRFDDTDLDWICPLGSHIRKVNPRQTGGVDDDQHRILRRSITYGPRIGDPRVPEDPTVDRGLIFVCYQQSIESGFLHIQRHWADMALSSAPIRGEVDPPEPLDSEPASWVREPSRASADFPDWVAKLWEESFPEEAPADPIIGRSGRLGRGLFELPRNSGGSIGVEVNNTWITYRDGAFIYLPGIEQLQTWFPLQGS